MKKIVMIAAATSSQHPGTGAKPNLFALDEAGNVLEFDFVKNEWSVLSKLDGVFVVDPAPVEAVQAEAAPDDVPVV